MIKTGEKLWEVYINRPPFWIKKSRILMVTHFKIKELGGKCALMPKNLGFFFRVIS